MSKLEQLKADGWSYYVGYQQDFKAYVARIWKDRPKPTWILTPLGQRIIVFRWCYSGQGLDIESAIEDCLVNKTAAKDDNYRNLKW